MNWVDLLVVLLALLAAVSGARSGLVTALLSFVGVFAGAIVGLKIAPLVLAQVQSPVARLAFGVACVVLLVALGETFGMWAGRELRDRITSSKLTGVDNALGSVLQFFAVLVVAWLVALPFTSASALPGLASALSGSKVLTTVNRLMPPQARALPDDLRQMLGVSGFPEALEPFTRTPVAQIAPPNDALANSPAVSDAHPSVLKVRGRAPSCSRALEGTGFVVSPHRVMTNAHVVAGTDKVSVESGKGTLDATVVLYRPDVDVAILDVPDLTARPLTFTENAKSGDDVIALGYPLDGPFTAAPGRIREQIRLRGPDIYDSQTVVRNVYTVRGRVQSGNSGGPLIDPQGKVVGVVFGAAVDDPETGFALTADQVHDQVDQAPGLSTPVDTGSCTR